MAKERSSNSKSTGRALLASFLALLLCLSTLLGTTFAWFTDSASTGVNTIKAGNLDVDLYYWNSSSSSDSGAYELVNDKTILFSDEELWEPGFTKVAYFKVENKGSLAANYAFYAAITKEIYGINKANTAYTLADSIKIALVDITEETNAVSGSVYENRSAVQSAVDAAEVTNSGEGNSLSNLVIQSSNEDNNFLSPAGSESGVVKYFAVIAYMPTDVGNEANAISPDQAASIEFTIIMTATQATSESDSFGITYDEAAQLGIENYGTVIKPEISDSNSNYVATREGVGSVTIPTTAKAEGETVSVEITKTDKPSNFTLSDSSNVVQYYNIDVDGIETSGNNNYTVSLYVGNGLESNTVKVTHIKDGISEEITGATYDASTGMVTFTTTSFSPFVVEGKSLFSGAGNGTQNNPFVLKNSNDIDKIRNYVSSVNTNNTIYFQLANSVVLTSAVTVSGNVEIIGDGNSVISNQPVYVSTNETVCFKNVNFATPKNSANNASSVYGSSLEGKVIFEGCNFTNPQWESIQITPLDGAEIVVNNCTFVVDGTETYAQVNGTKVERMLHIQNTAASGNYKATITNNKFIGVEYCRNAVIDVDDIKSFDNVTCGGNTFYKADNESVKTLADGMIYVNINGKYDSANIAANTYIQFTQTPATSLKSEI